MKRYPLLLMSLLLVLCASAWASPAYVQSNSNCNFFGTSATTVTVGGSSATTCPTSTGWASNVTAGNTIAGFVWRKTGSGTLNSVSDGGDTCVAVNTSGTAGTSNAMLLYGFYCYNVAGGNKPTVTLTFSVSENFWYAVVQEFSGTATTSPLDGSAFVGMSTTGGGTNAATTGNWTTSTNGDYIIGGFIDDGGGMASAADVSAGSTSQSWTVRFGPDVTHSEAMVTEDGVQTAASATTVIAFTTTVGSNPLLGAMAFKPPPIPPNLTQGGHLTVGGKVTAE